jgi:hypothetical protein
VGDVGVGALDPAQREVGADGVEGLFVLAPADIADEALVVEQDALAAGGDLQGGAGRPGQLGAVQFGDVGVVDHRVAGLVGAVQRRGGRAGDVDRVVLGADLADVLELDQALDALELGALPAEAGADGEGRGVVLQGGGLGLVDAFVAGPDFEDQLAGGDLVADGRRRGRRRRRLDGLGDGFGGGLGRRFAGGRGLGGGRRRRVRRGLGQGAPPPGQGADRRAATQHFSRDSHASYPPRPKKNARRDR